jgi:hypothetical protein
VCESKSLNTLKTHVTWILKQNSQM